MEEKSRGVETAEAHKNGTFEFARFPVGGRPGVIPNCGVAGSDRFGTAIGSRERRDRQRTLRGLHDGMIIPTTTGDKLREMKILRRFAGAIPTRAKVALGGFAEAAP